MRYFWIAVIMLIGASTVIGRDAKSQTVPSDGEKTATSDTSKLQALQAQYEKLAARYQDKCKSNDYEGEMTLLHIQQGAGLAGGIVFPMTMEMVSVIRGIQKNITNDLCERATEYADLAKVFGDILENDVVISR